MSESIQKYISRVFKDESLGIKPVYSKEFKPAAGRYVPLRSSSGLLQRTLAEMGISELYEHQAQAIDLVRSGQNAVTATPTASGKSLIYNLCVLEAVLNGPDSRALYLFPLKALTQDQHQFIQDVGARVKKEGAEVFSAVYDGDTDSDLRRMIRRDPPHILLTNPDMLHKSILP
ncbi:MAG: DEAD/DEAH box helicase, partial [Desulfonatronovibrionaceae bacterium]